MTIRELVQKLLSEAPDLDADVYINEPINDIENKEFIITAIDNGGSDDSVSIILKRIY